MKKLLIILVIVLNSFLIIDNVSAETLLNKYEKDIHYTNTYEMTDDEIRQLYNEIESSNDYTYTHNFFTIEDYINARNKLKSMNLSKEYILYQYAGYLYYTTINDYIPSIAIFNNDNGLFGINFGFNSEALGSKPHYRYYSETNSFSSNSNTRFFGPHFYSSTFNSSEYDLVDFYETNYHSENMQYFLPVYGSDKYSGDITYNNETYSINSYLPIDIYNGLNSLIDSSYNETIDVTDVDYIKVKIDVNDIIENSGNLEIEYDITSENNYEIGPYIETLYYDENGYMVQNKDTMESTDNLAYCLLQDLNTTVYYDLVIPTAGITGNINLYFKSQLGYEVVLYYSNGSTSNDEVYTSTLTKLDLADYKGVVVMPKLYSDTDDLAQIYSVIHYDGYKNVSLSGIYDIFVFGVPGNYTTLIDSYIDYDKSNFSYPFNSDDPRQNKLYNYIKFIKKESSEESYIILDTNLFTYSYIINEIDDVIIQDANFPHINHNTGNVDDTYKLHEANNSLNDVDTAFDKILKFIDDMSGCMFVFSDLITFTYNNLNSYCQNLIVVVFVLLVIVGLILLLRRK